jgi:hypothetical protein
LESADRRQALIPVISPAQGQPAFFLEPAGSTGYGLHKLTTETNLEKRLIGYPRVSIYGQTFESQLAQLRAAGCSGRKIASTASKIESNVTLGLAAADQQIARGRQLDWVRPVAHRADDEPGLASVADPGPACPPHGHIACLGKFEEALEGRGPADV